MEQEQTVYCLLEGRDVFAVMPMGIACRVRCWNSNITTGVNNSNLSLISNILDTLYVPQENDLLVDVDSVLALKKTALFVVKPGAVACKPIRNTLRFQGFAERAKQKTVIAV